MKNDPHVTEVSDEGALLKRYRNEIVDLKRRLLEVRIRSSTLFYACRVTDKVLKWCSPRTRITEMHYYTAFHIATND